MYMYVYINIYVCIYINTCINMYVYVYTYTHLVTYRFNLEIDGLFENDARAHIHTHMHTPRTPHTTTRLPTLWCTVLILRLMAFSKMTPGCALLMSLHRISPSAHTLNKSSGTIGSIPAT